MTSELRRTSAGRIAEGPVLVVVMDGVGLGPKNEGNAVHLARKPTLDRLARGPTLELAAHGTAVGLPSDDDMGNSEVGHNALGAGRVFAQGAKLVNAAIASRSIFEGPAWREIADRCRSPGSALHLIGLLSDGNVHSHVDHFAALIDEAARAGVRSLFVHALLDGRDVPETSAPIYIERMLGILAPHDAKPGHRYRIASGGGRMRVTMDRYEADWGMVELGWRTHVRGEGERFPTALAAVEALRARTPGVIDQDLGPFVIGEDAPTGPIRDGDAVVFVNFRGDRAIEISRAFEDDAFAPFDRGARPEVLYAGMMQYDGDYQIPKRFLVAPPAIDRTMSQLLSAAGVRQFACSETQKYGHVTYFWNGNRGGKFDGETWLEVPSDRVSFSERPWMKAAEITDATIEALLSDRYDFIRINYANGDMVGHTGVLDATVLAVEAVDLSLGRLLEVAAKKRAVALVTADHGNADEMYMWDPKKGRFKLGRHGRIEAKTSHTLNPVPFHLVAPHLEGRLGLGHVERPGLANVASTVLELLGFERPEEYEPSLLAER
jgi:2,3-bisphosphoglycerate-independent phosphoglycerate mutase